MTKFYAQWHPGPKGNKRFPGTKVTLLHKQQSYRHLCSQCIYVFREKKE